MPFLKKSLLALTILAVVSPAFANRIENDVSHIDIQTALQQFSSVNQLGELTLSIPKSEYFTTANGIPVVFTPMSNIPIVDIDVDFKNAGSLNAKYLREDGDLIADMAATAFLQGTTSLDEEQFAEKMALIAGSLSAEADNEYFSFSIRSLTDDSLPEILAMFADIYKNPRFDAEILERNKARQIEAAKESEESPDYLANRAFRGIMQANDPTAFTNPAERFNKLTRDELIAFKERFLVADNAKIAITGDVSLERAKQIAEQIAQVLPKGEKAQEAKPFGSPKPIHYHITHPSTQTFVLIGGVSPATTPNKTPDEIQRYSDYGIANSVMAGGDFNARLMQAIRVKKGYTYGISGGLSSTSQRGLYSIEFSTKNEDASNAIADTLAVVDDVLKNGITQAELDLEKTGRKNSYPTRFGSHSGVHGAVAGMFFDEYPKDYLSKRLEYIDATTVEQANNALRYFVKPENFVVVTVGATKPKLILPSAKVAKTPTKAKVSTKKGKKVHKK